MFSQACAKNSVHGGRGRHMVHILSGQTPPRQTPPGADTPLWAETSLGRHLQADTPWADTPWSDPPLGRHPPFNWILQDMVNKRVVRILLECILIMWCCCFTDMILIYRGHRYWCWFLYVYDTSGPLQLWLQLIIPDRIVRRWLCID